jgi:hypothetical protein
VGAWGAGSFENDAALDWLGELRRGEASLREALNDAASASRPLDVDGASAAIAAAELVAESRGQKGQLRLPKDATLWLAAQKVPFPDEVVTLAHQAVTRVLASSELQQLWDEQGPNNDWRIVTQTLLRRLASLSSKKRTATSTDAKKPKVADANDAGGEGAKKPGRKKKAPDGETVRAGKKEPEG